MSDTLALTIRELAELGRLAGEVEVFGRAHDFSAKVIYALNFAIEEAITNTLGHGSSGLSGGEIRIRIRIEAGDVSVEIEDEAPEFNPLLAAEPDTTASLEERRVGGLGIFLTRKLMDSMEYRREGGKNLLVMKKRLAPNQGATKPI